MATKELPTQLPLVPASNRVPQPLHLPTLFSKTTFRGALEYVIQCGNFEYEKEVYQSLGIDAGNWTRIMNGSASFPQDKEEALHALCGNNGLLVWRAHRLGLGLVELEDGKDKQIRELREENSRLQNELDTLAKYGVIRRPG